MIIVPSRKENAVGHVQRTGEGEDHPGIVTGIRTKNHGIERKVGVRRKEAKVEKERTVRANLKSPKERKGRKVQVKPKAQKFRIVVKLRSK